MKIRVSTKIFLLTLWKVISKVTAEPDPNFHIYLAFGQSNMEGQATIEEADRIVDPRFQVLSTVDGCHNRTLGEWYVATPPLAHCHSQIGPMDFFGRKMVQELPEDIKVGVVVVAVGGSGIGLFERSPYYYIPSWMEELIQTMYGGDAYGRLMDMAKKAQESGVIKGILMHQGEANAGEVTWPDRVKDLYEKMLAELNLKAEQVPLLAGEVVHSDMGGQSGKHNSLIQKLPEIIPTAHVISSQDLAHTGDRLHFTHEAYQILGERYAEEMLHILSNTDNDDNNNDNNNNNDDDNNYDDDNDNQPSCWSIPLGYPCCSSTTPAIYYSDSDGDWSVENNEWCGIYPPNKSSSCWSDTLGYPCCPTNSCRNVIYVDNDGRWDIEDNEWCGITTDNTIC